jgi:hypothetical protein
MKIAFLLVFTALAGCAHDCGQLAHERWQRQPRLDEVRRQLDRGRTGEFEAEYARLEGEVDAIRRAAVAGNCADG